MHDYHFIFGVFQGFFVYFVCAFKFSVFSCVGETLFLYASNIKNIYFWHDCFEIGVLGNVNLIFHCFKDILSHAKCFR